MQYVLYADEANPEQNDATRFFIYGGAIIPAEAIGRIHEQIDELRTEYQLGRETPLKFASRDRPAGMSVADHTRMKERVYEIASANHVRFSGYAILHAIARRQDHETLVEWGANIVLAKFNEFLGEKDAKGWAIFDRMNTPNPYGFLRAKFANRIQIDEGRVFLENVIGYSFSCDSASHVSSMTDILVGGFRYIINEPGRDLAGRAILHSLLPVFWDSRRADGSRRIAERGLVLRPRTIWHPGYAADYQELRDRLRRWSEAKGP